MANQTSSDPSISLDLLTKRVDELSQENLRLRGDHLMSNHLKSDGEGSNSESMDLLNYRMGQYEKHADAADARMERIEGKLNDIQLMLTSVSTKDTVRNWGLGLVAIIFATAAAVAALMLQASGNQLSAFQAGLSTIQTVVAAAPMSAPHPAATPSNPAPAKPNG